MKNVILTLFIFLLSFDTFCQKNDTLTTYYFIRHAETVFDGTQNPHLSSAGLKRVDKLISYFNDKKLDAIYSTDYWRTKETATPIANKKSFEIQLYDPRNWDFDSFLNNTKGQNILIVGHSNTTPWLINHILNEQKFNVIGENDYGNIFIVTIGKGNNVNVDLKRIE